MSEHKEIRKPAVAGSFYPANPIELTKTVAEFFTSVEKQPLSGRPMAVIAPHAGYPYSGKTAASAFKLLEGEQFDTVVIIAPSHTVFFKGSSVYQGDGYETPLGIVETDHELSQKITSINPSVSYSNMGHATGGKRGEHSLEVQLPFLQIALGKFKLVAIVMGEQEESSIRALGETLASTLAKTNTLMVASTDLSHFHSETEARRLDYAIQNAIEGYDPDRLMETLESGEGEACGGGPVAAVMMAAKRLGGSEVKFIDYTTSGETTGQFEEVVGYLSAVVVAGKKTRVLDQTMGSKEASKPAGEIEAALSIEVKSKLLRIAHQAVVAHLNGVEYKPDAIIGQERGRGLFVTLHQDNELRGCIGRVRTKSPLHQTVAEMALASAFEDPRFDPVTQDELRKLSFEISVLSPLERVRYPEQVKVGRDGLMVKLDLHSGLLLPQVATENGWDRTEFLEQTCLKAGLPKKSYLDPQAEVYMFSAEVFSDEQ